jgi:hypothetical protein
VVVIENAAAFPPKLFEASAEFGPCSHLLGVSSIASRTWIRIIDDDTNQVLDTKCTFASGVPSSVATPVKLDDELDLCSWSTLNFRIELWDTMLDKIYSSNVGHRWCPPI